MRLRRCYLTIMLALLTMAASAIDSRVEQAWGKLYIEHNGRICPMSVVCRYPMADMENPPLVWPQAETEEETFFQDRAMNLLYMYLYEENYDEAVHLLVKIREYQEKHVSGLPSPFRCWVEQSFHRLPYTKPLAIICLTIGLLLVILTNLSIRRMTMVQKYYLANVLAGILWAFLTVMLSARWYLSGHIPFGGGHETMQVMAWFALVIAIVPLYKHNVLRNHLDHISQIPPLAILAAGFALLVSNMAAYNPEIDELMPALQSPWLASHVSSIMFSYALFTILTLMSVIALIKREDYEVNLVLLDAAVVFLTIGIGIGSLWAKTAWGTYWNWDPKETWALITLCVYLVPMLWSCFGTVRRPWIFHLYCIFAFISVIITYFGVNFFFGGLHSYA